jgi:hypothetical protein
VLGHGVALALLQLVHPFEGNRVVAGGEMHQLLGAELLNGTHLLLHCGLASRISPSLGGGSRFTSVREVQLGEESWHRRLSWLLT